MSNWQIAKNAYQNLFEIPRMVLPFLTPLILAIVSMFLFSLIRLIPADKIHTPAFAVLIMCLIFLSAFVGLFAVWKQMEAQLITVRCASKLMRGEYSDAKSEAEYVKSRIMGYIGLQLILFLIYIAIYMIGFTLGYSLGGGSLSASSIVMVIIAVISTAFISILVSVYTQFATPIYALSNSIGPLAAIKESFRITTENKMAANILVTLIFIILIIAIPYIIIGIIPIFGNIITGVFNALAMPVINLFAITHLYLKSLNSQNNQIS